MTGSVVENPVCSVPLRRHYKRSIYNAEKGTAERP